MTPLTEITTWLDSYLKIPEIPDYSGAHNGLQVENNGDVTRVGSAVDASLKSIQQAADLGVDLLVVHHGLYWQGVERLTGAWKEKCQLLLENNMALYSAHLPLDLHPQIGNNILLAQAIGLNTISPCLPWNGINLALKGTYNDSSSSLIHTLTELLGAEPQCILEGPEQIEELYIITGGAGSEITKISELGGKNFLTGEGSHWNAVYAQDHKMNLFLGTHYLTETFGVESLADLICEQFSLHSCEKVRSTSFL